MSRGVKCSSKLNISPFKNMEMIMESRKVGESIIFLVLG